MKRKRIRALYFENWIQKKYAQLGRSNFGENPLWLSYKGRTVDALAPGADEGRGERRNASGSCKRALIRRCPNGETHDP